MKIMCVVATAAAFGLSAPALAQATDQAPAKAKPAVDLNKRVCHDEGETGSRLASHRECHTVAEWNDIQRQQRADIQQAQSATGR